MDIPTVDVDRPTFRISYVVSAVGYDVKQEFFTCSVLMRKYWGDGEIEYEVIETYEGYTPEYAYKRANNRKDAIDRGISQAEAFNIARGVE